MEAKAQHDCLTFLFFSSVHWNVNFERMFKGIALLLWALQMVVSVGELSRLSGNDYIKIILHMIII